MKTLKISIPHPCSQSWNEMSSTEKGRFCQHCQKTVTDYSAMNDKQLIAAKHSNGGNTCGRYAPGQLNRELINEPRRSIFPAAVLASLLAAINPTGTKAAASPIQVNIASYSTKKDHITPQDTTGRMITGQVLEKENNRPLIGTTIKIKGTDIKTVTDMEGNFQLFSPTEQCILIVNSIGFESVEVIPAANAPVQVKMEYNVMGLDGWQPVKRSRWKTFRHKMKNAFSRL